VSITIKVNGVEALKSDLIGLTPKLEKAVLLQLSQVAYESARQGAGRHVKTGALLQSLFNRAIPRGREVGHDLDRTRVRDSSGRDRGSYATFVLFGTRPHTIEPSRIWSPKNPKRRAALRWAGPGGWIYARSVNHPGYRGDHYLNRAADEAIRQFDAIVNQAFKESAS
jgi:hypothetical protein